MASSLCEPKHQDLASHEEEEEEEEGAWAGLKVTAP